MAYGTYVTINGVDVSDYVFHWEVPETFGKSIDELNMLVSKTISDVITLVNEMVVIVKRGDTSDSSLMTYYFRGFLTTWSPKGATLEIIAKNKLQQANKREVTQNFDKNDDPEAGILSSIATTILESYAGYSSSNVVDSTPYVRAIDKFPNNHDKCLDRVDVIRQILNWSLRYDYEADEPVMEPKGYTANTNVLRYDGTSSQNVLEIPKWDNNSDQILNSVTIIGRPAGDIYTQTFSGDGSTTTFTLTKTPYQTEVYVDGTKKTRGITGQSGSYDYTVDQLSKRITFVTAPASGSSNITINYGVFHPPAVTREDADSIDVYKISEDTFQFYDVITLDDAETRANEILDRFSTPLKSTMLRVTHLDTDPLRAGQTIRVVDTDNSIDDQFIITDILHQWPEPEDYVNVGNDTTLEQNTILAIEDRLAQLEKQNAQNLEDITISKDLNANLRVGVYLRVDHHDTSVDGAWGKGFGNGTDSDTLTWGETGALWQNTYTNSEALWAIVWPDNIYEEDFATEDFVDSSNTTATVDTTNAEVRF